MTSGSFKVTKTISKVVSDTIKLGAFGATGVALLSLVFSCRARTFGDGKKSETKAVVNKKVLSGTLMFEGVFVDELAVNSELKTAQKFCAYYARSPLARNPDTNEDLPIIDQFLASFDNAPVGLFAAIENEERKDHVPFSIYEFEQVYKVLQKSLKAKGIEGLVGQFKARIELASAAVGEGVGAFKNVFAFGNTFEQGKIALGNEGNVDKIELAAATIAIKKSFEEVATIAQKEFEVRPSLSRIFASEGRDLSGQNPAYTFDLLVRIFADIPRNPLTAKIGCKSNTQMKQFLTKLKSDTLTF